MPNPLIPQLDQQRLTVQAVMSRPTVIRDRIALLADKEVLLPKLFRPYGAVLSGAGMLYSVIKASDFFTADPLERRQPGAEYAVIRGTDPESKLAVVDDFGGRVQVLDEDVLRNDINRIDTATIQIKNRITRTLDIKAIAAVEAAGVDSIAVSVPWDQQKLVGPATDITPSGARPTAHFAVAQEMADLDELGVQLDTLLVSPGGARALRTLYAENLGDMLDSAGLTMFSNPRIPNATAYLAQAGAVGTVGFEVPLTVEVVPERTTRSSWLMGYCVPAIAVTNPGAVVKLTGILSA